MFGKFLTVAAAATMVAAPVAASAAPSAASLSVVKQVRASSNGEGSQLAGGVGFLPIFLLAGVAAIAVLGIIEANDDYESDSN